MVYKVTRFDVIPTEKGIDAPIKEAYKVDDSGEKISEDKFLIKQEKEKAKKKVFLQEIKDRGVITEKELLLIKRRLNDGTYTSKEVYDTIIGDDGIKLTSDQQEKGRKWLMDKWKSPTGKVRENSPYGYREEQILEKFNEVRLKGFYDAGNYNSKNFVPLYEVSGDDTTMKYYVKGGEPSIVG